MKNLFKKINNDKVLFTVFIFFCFLLFDFITTGLGIWDGLLSTLINFFDDLYEGTFFGKSFIGEVFWFLLLIPVIILFKNKYIFTQKKEKLSKSLINVWPLLTLAIIMLIGSFLSIEVNRIKPAEVVALILMTATIGLFEELLCRGWIENEFLERFGKDNKGVIYSIVASSIIFGIMHAGNILAGQDVILTIMQIINAIFMGMVLGTLYYKTKNIWSVIILHGFWDFSVMFSMINQTTSCSNIMLDFTSLPIYVKIGAFLGGLIIGLPSIMTALMLLNKETINEGLDKKHQIELTEEVKQNCKKRKKLFGILSLVAVIIVGVINITGNTTNKIKCPTYVKKDVKNYQEVITNYEEHNIEVEKLINVNNCDVKKDTNCIEELTKTKLNIKFDINKDNKLVITNTVTNKSKVLEYKDVLKVNIIENDNKYFVSLISAADMNSLVIYYSDYITLENISNDSKYLDKVAKSFTKLEIPSNIVKMGYYQEENDNYKYPLFISSTKEKYILGKDKTIYTYKK